MSKVFYPPTYTSGFQIANVPRLWQFYQKAMEYGLTVVKFSNTDYQIIEVPTQDELQRSLTYYLGGRRYVISDAEADLLAEAGYTQYIVDTSQDEYLDIYDDDYSTGDELESEPVQKAPFLWLEANVPPPDWWTTPTAYTGDEENTDTGGGTDGGSGEGDLGGYGSGGYGGGGYGS